MREIKFRAWDKAEKTWLEYEEIFLDQQGDIYLIEERTWAYQSYMHTENLNEKVEIMQYTGLKDKNGKEIYEGDIVEWDEKEWGAPNREVVICDYELLSSRKTDWQQFCEVIGNIYENPKLVIS